MKPIIGNYYIFKSAIYHCVFKLIAQQALYSDRYQIKIVKNMHKNQSINNFIDWQHCIDKKFVYNYTSQFQMENYV